MKILIAGIGQNGKNFSVFFWKKTMWSLLRLLIMMKAFGRAWRNSGCGTVGCQNAFFLQDYFHGGFGSARGDVEDYEKIHGIMLAKTPIGDECSIAIIKQ